MTDDREIVPAVRRALAERVGGDRYDLWFGSATRFRICDDRLIVGVPNLFLQDWLRTNFRGHLEDAVRETIGPTATVAFEVDEQLAARRGDAAPDDAQRSEAANSTATKGPETAAGAAAQPAATASPPPRRLSAPRKPHTFEEFVVGASNRLAYASARGVVERPGSISPLVVHGPTGTGKTHLLEAIVEGVRRLSRDAQTAYLTAEQFTTSFLEALHGGGLPNFRRKFRGLHLLAIDDLQFLAGKKATIVELIHTVEALGRDGRQVVFAADRAPGELTFLGPELRNRLAGGLVVGLTPPDMAVRLGIVGAMARRMNLSLTHDVAEFVAASFTTHARELAGALKRLSIAACAYGRPIDRDLAEEALGELIRSQQKAVRLADIEKAVCDVFGLEPETLQSERKDKGVSHPRMLAMWLARKYTRAALSEIGHYFGGRSHSTVISAQRKVTEWLSAGEPLRTAGGNRRFDEVLQRVEATLLGKG